MPVRVRRTPSYRHHKPSGQAVVTLDGRDFYLGHHGTPESRNEYDRLVAEWLAHGRRLPASDSTAGPDLTVNELLVAYLRYADSYYVKDGRPTSEPANIRLAMRPLRQLYGHTLTRDFGPKALKAVRQAMIETGLCRNEVNKRVGKVVRAFKWAVGEEMITPSVYHGLQAVAGLRRGRSGVRESKPVRTVPEAFVDAIEPYVSRQVWAMVQIQRLTGMRPGEVCILRSCDLDITSLPWTYIPERHKTQHHGRQRVVKIGPRARAVLQPWLRAELTAYLFSPKDAMEELRAEQRRQRQTPVTPSQRRRTRRRKPRKQPGDHYTTESYRRAIAYACRGVGVTQWHPNRLRHNAATRLRKEYDLDTARAILGHSSPAVTEIYAELDGAKAADAMEKVG